MIQIKSKSLAILDLAVAIIRPSGIPSQNYLRFVVVFPFALAAARSEAGRFMAGWSLRGGVSIVFFRFLGGGGFKSDIQDFEKL